MFFAFALAVSLEIGAMPAEKAYEEQSVKYTGSEYKNEEFKYRLLKPEKIEPGKKYPLVLFLHGAGERGTDNVKQLLYFPAIIAKPEMREKYPCFVIAPQCRSDKRWVEVDWSAKEPSPMIEPSDQMKVVLQILDKVANENPVDRDRVYLTGLSMGGYGSWDLAMRMPERFAAVAPICGGGDEQSASKLAGVPVWAFHGDDDQAVPVDRSRRMIAAIEKAGGHPKYSELKGVGHNSWTPAYEDPKGLIPWMFEQKRTN
jgi:predicted peptidase